MVEMHEWELIGSRDRLAVPSGWVYVVYDGGVFVPDPDAEHVKSAKADDPEPASPSPGMADALAKLEKVRKWAEHDRRMHVNDRWDHGWRAAANHVLLILDAEPANG